MLSEDNSKLINKDKNECTEKYEHKNGPDLYPLDKLTIY